MPSSAARRRLAQLAAGLALATLIALGAVLIESTRRWLQTIAVAESLAPGADLSETARQIPLTPERVTRQDAIDWRHWTANVLTDDERPRVTTLLVYWQDGGYGPAPGRCVFYFDSNDRLVKTVLDR